MLPAEALAGLAGVALFAAPGAGLAELLPAVRTLRPAERLAYAWLLGVAWTAGLLYGLSHFVSVPLRPPAVLAVAGLPALAGAVSALRRRRRAGPPAPRRRSGRRPMTEKLALAAGALVVLALLGDALDSPLRDWDGRMTWAAQARWVQAEGTVDPRVLTEPGWFVSHPWYPLLLPVAQAAVQEVTRAGWDQHAFRALYAAFFPAWLLVVHGAARRLAGRRAAGWTALAMALLPFPAFAQAGGATTAYSDLPLACFFGAGLLLLTQTRPRPSAGLAAGLLLGAAVLTKAEGTVLALAALGIAALQPFLIGGSRLRRWRRRRRPLALAAVPVALALALLLSWRAGIPERFESFEQATSWAYLWPGIVLRAPAVARAAGAAMLRYVSWGVFWPAALLVLAAGRRGLRRRVSPALALAAAVPLGVGWVYATISHRLEFVVSSTWDRFLVQASVPLLLLLALALGDALRRASWPARPRRRSARSPSPERSTPA